MYNGIYNKVQFAYMYDTLVKWLTARVQGGSLGENLRVRGIGRVALYGINGLGAQVYQDLAEAGMEVVCFIDKNAGRFGGEKDGLPVLNLFQLEQVPKDCCVLVTPEFYFQEIMEELLQGGIPLERIISLSMVV